MSEAKNNEVRDLDWDSTIENEGQAQALLPEGVYPFFIKETERTTAKSGSKMMTVTLEIDGGAKGRTTVRDYLVLRSDCEWKLCQFFVGIGQRKHGEAFTMNWNRVQGARGHLKLKQEEYTDKNGKSVLSNKVDSYLEPPEPGNRAADLKPAASQEPGGIAF